MRLTVVGILAIATLCLAMPGSARASQKRFPSGAIISVTFEKAGIGGTARIVRSKAGERPRVVVVDYVSDEPVIITETTFDYFSIGIMDLEAPEMDQHCDYRIVVDWKQARIAKTTLLPGSFKLCSL